MPIYCYKDKKTKKMVDVVRKFSEYEDVPTVEEATEFTEEEYKAADWERVIGQGIKVTRSSGYGTKGNWAILLAVLIGALFGQSMVAEGAEYYLMEPEKLSLDATKIINYRDAYIPDYTTLEEVPRDSKQEEHWVFGAAFNLDLNILRVNNTRVIYWDNRINMVSTDNQVRYVAWDYEAGFTLVHNRVKLFYHHKSEHWLEGGERYGNYRYPLLDEVTLRIIFLERD